jgi:2-C-methyl-D-erythritol 2,4-cyclodiphosphate synthase
MNIRVGQGWDLHRLVAGRLLMLGGVAIPSELGELGHSDGDVLFHAIVDAMLGAIGAGDIGRHFPPSDQRWKDVPSRVFAERASELLAESGWHIVNVDSTVVLERPKLAPHIDDIRASIAGALGLPVGCVSVKAKTHEGVDAAGRLEAIEAQAVVLVEHLEH